LLKALDGNALATFPREAFEDDIVVHRFLGHRQFIFNRPDAIRRILVENSGNYVRTAPTIRALGPIFGGGVFLSTGEEWKRQRRTTPRLLHRARCASWRGTSRPPETCSSLV
jgi:cytochrome P450